jgi:hypothetical protein
MAKPVTLWTVATEAHIQSQPNSCRICVRQRGTGKDFIRVLRSSIVSISKYIPCSFAYQLHHIILAVGSIGNCAVLCYYTLCSCNSLRTFWDNLSVPSSLVKHFFPLGIITARCVITQKSAVLICFAVVA